MVANIRGYTPNYKFKLVNFDTPRWHTLEYANWTELDGLLLQAGIAQIRGDWANATLYYVGDRAVDTTTNLIYRCLVQHTSSAGVTFAQDRASHPTWWTLQTAGVPLFRGAWTTNTTYAPGDIVFVNLYTYYLCILNHRSSPAFATDVASWTLIFDATAAVNTTNANATAAANSATNSADSATASAASATQSANSATASATSATDSAAQAQKLFGTSTTSVVIGLGAKTFTTQASKYFNVGKFVMMRATANPVDAWMWGQVASYSGTSLTVNSQAFGSVGTYADWMIDVSGIKGADGSGGGSGTSSVTTSDIAPSTPRDGDLWWKTDVGVMFVYYDDGDSQQWVQATPIPQTSTDIVGVSNDQNFTEVQKAQGRENIYAAPFDALAYNGMQFNGSMEVNQYGATIGAAGGYPVDGWNLSMTGAPTIQPSSSNYNQGVVSGLPYLLYINIAVGQPSLAAADSLYLTHSLEGYRISRLGWGAAGAQPITIAFWTVHVRAGVHSGVVCNIDASRSYAFTYTQNVSGAPEYKIVTIPGDTTGTWVKDNTTGMRLRFAVASGTTYTAPSANVWLNGNYIAAPGQVNGAATTSDAFRITGLIVLPGIEAPSAARSSLIMRPYDQELLTCKRYYEKNVNFVDQTRFVGEVALGGTYYHNIHFTVTKRAIPTVTATDGGATQRFNLAPDLLYICEQGFLEGRAATATGYGIFTSDWIADARL
jgi:hypothetical protein